MTKKYYEKAYKEALERARAINSGKDVDVEAGTTICEYIFPQLKMNDDEKTRKDLLSFIKAPYVYDVISQDRVDPWIAWLEKQGKSIRIKKGKNYLCTKTHKYAGLEWIEGVKYYSPEDYALVNQGCTCHCPEYSKEEHNNFFKEVEYDGCVEVDNVKPKLIKFNVGDWIACEELNTAKIISFDSDRYIVEFIDGSRGLPHIDYVDRRFHLWSIADAKEGDVLVNGSNIFIFHFINDTRLMGYCHVNVDDGRFYDDIGKNECFCLIDAVVNPATKEQRDFLFQKMEEAGYQWNDEKKELKKVYKNPKFHVDDWVVCECGEDSAILQIKNIIYGTYEFTDDSTLDVVDEDSLRLWTINDAKDGDVLAVEPIEGYPSSFVTIYKKQNGEDFDSYCFVGFDGKFYKGENGHSTEEIHPTTKEQRDLLFTKMKEAGYEFDFDNKELKKIEDEECNGEYYGIDGLWHAQRILEKTLGSVDGYQSDDGILEHKAAITAVKKLCEKKPDWSEEDVENLNRIIGVIERREMTSTVEQYKDILHTYVYWLKSLKTRVQHNPKIEWSDEDEAYKEFAISAVEDYYDEENPLQKELVGWLKSLKDKLSWKPSKEQMETLEYYMHTLLATEHKEVLFGLYDDLKKL